LLFAGNGVGDSGEALEVDEFVDFVSAGEASRVCTILVLCYSCFDFCCDADVEALKAAGHDVDVRLFDHGGILQL
jgi:hypothetical protein